MRTTHPETQSFVHVCIQVIELQELTCRIVPKFFGGFPKKEMFTQIFLCLFSACHQTLSPYSSFRCWSIPVSEIREFNQKEKMNNSKSGYFAI